MGPNQGRSGGPAAEQADLPRTLGVSGRGGDIAGHREVQLLSAEPSEDTLDTGAVGRCRGGLGWHGVLTYRLGRPRWSPRCIRGWFGRQGAQRGRSSACCIPQEVKDDHDPDLFPLVAKLVPIKCGNKDSGPPHADAESAKRLVRAFSQPHPEVTKPTNR